MRFDKISLPSKLAVDYGIELENIFLHKSGNIMENGLTHQGII
jgi:hypothetical protein